MSQTFNIYCDESCHLENDGKEIMVIGAVWSPLEKVPEVSTRLLEMKRKHGLADDFEMKWTKVSPAKIDFYLDVLDFFFDYDDLHFRGIIAPKDGLDHKKFQQTHDDWYYKIYFDMIKILLSPKAKYRIYIDIKDSRGGTKVAKLHEVLCSNMYDFSRTILERVQIVRSDESEMMQLTDLLVGIISYVNRGLDSSEGKMALVSRMKKRSGYELTKNTLFREEKVNLLRWEPRK